MSVFCSEEEVGSALFTTEVVLFLTDGLEVKDEVSFSIDTDGDASLPGPFAEMDAGERHEHDEQVGQLHDAEVAIAKAEPLCRVLAEAMLRGESKAERESARCKEALIKASLVAAVVEASLRVIKAGGPRPSLPDFEAFGLSASQGAVVAWTYDHIADGIKRGSTALY